MTRSIQNKRFLVYIGLITIGLFLFNIPQDLNNLESGYSIKSSIKENNDLLTFESYDEREGLEHLAASYPEPPVDFILKTPTIGSVNTLVIPIYF